MQNNYLKGIAPMLPIKAKLLLFAVIVTIWTIYILLTPIGITKKVTSSFGITNIYTHYQAKTTLSFNNKIKLAIIKSPNTFDCKQSDYTITIQPNKQKTSSDMIVILEDSTLYRLILVERDSTTYYKQVQFINKIL